MQSDTIGTYFCDFYFSCVSVAVSGCVLVCICVCVAYVGASDLNWCIYYILSAQFGGWFFGRSHHKCHGGPWTLLSVWWWKHMCRGVGFDFSFWCNTLCYVGLAEVLLLRAWDLWCKAREWPRWFPSKFYVLWVCCAKKRLTVNRVVVCIQAVL